MHGADLHGADPCAAARCGGAPPPTDGRSHHGSPGPGWPPWCGRLRRRGARWAGRDRRCRDGSRCHAGRRRGAGSREPGRAGPSGPVRPGPAGGPHGRRCAHGRDRRPGGVPGAVGRGRRCGGGSPAWSSPLGRCDGLWGRRGRGRGPRRCGGRRGLR
ncbi:hypothetical protein [Raineyella sp. W15-4]|uniref:hypothetical protein n=1 Tax=Raineyella sp. W15-4 TaxID=3081651 RepID=UPI00398A4A50